MRGCIGRRQGDAEASGYLAAASLSSRLGRHSSIKVAKVFVDDSGALQILAGQHRLSLATHAA